MSCTPSDRQSVRIVQMKIKMLIIILPSFFKFSFFPSVTPIYNAYGNFSSKFSQQLLDLGL